MVMQKKENNKEELISVLIKAVSQAGLDIDNFRKEGKIDLNKMINSLTETRYLTVEKAKEIAAIFQ